VPKILSVTSHFDSPEGDMATPYWQLRRDEVPSTQDLARAELVTIPVVVIAAAQTAGRGRSGAEWVTAPRALAVSVATQVGPGERRPLSLIAGVAAKRALDASVALKWPNDLEVDYLKIGGILVEQSDGVAVIGMGLNLWWPEPPDGVGALLDENPGPRRHVELGALWAIELQSLISADGWPIDEYRDCCATLGREIVWEPGGSGKAIDVGEDGALLVEVEGEIVEVHSGAVRHVRG
jgi:BirA family biotin operon repressor/biotin-[acetyl-CoA-carboxylase] ligase